MELPVRVIVLRLIASLLLGLAVFHLFKGFSFLLFNPAGGADLNWRFQEIHLFWRIPLETGTAMIHQGVLRWDKANYLPSSHILGALFVPPLSWNFAKYYYAIMNILAIASVIYASLLLSKPFDVPVWLIASVVLACSNLQTTLAFGQYSILTLALLSWSMVSFSRGCNYWGIVFLVFATVKPVLCLPLFVALLTFRQWGPFLFSSLIVALLNIAGFWFSDDSLRVHLRNYFSIGSTSMFRGYGLNSLLEVLGFPPNMFLCVGIVAVVALFCFLFKYRKSLWTASPLTFLALSCFAGRAWFPSYSHDNVMFIPMLAAVVAKTYQDPRFEAVLVAALLGASLWIPGRWMNGSVGIEVFQWSTWLYAVVFLLRGCFSTSQGVPNGSLDRPKDPA